MRRLGYGTTTINCQDNGDRTDTWIVNWCNVGNDLRNEPRGFWTREDAVEWCRERGLRVVQRT